MPRIHGNVERGWKRGALIRQLALAEKTKVQLSKEFGITLSGLRSFEKRHEYDILLAQQDLQDEYIGIWIAEKRNRILELQQCVEDIEAISHTWDGILDIIQEGIDNPDEVPEEWLKVTRKFMSTHNPKSPGPDWLLAKAKILRQVAEELGHLKQTVDLKTTVTKYEVEGVDTKDLQ